MKDTHKNLRRIVLFVCFALLLLFAVFAFNQMVALYNNLEGIHPILAMGVIILCSAVVAALIVLTVVALFRYPEVETLPTSGDEEEYREFLNRQYLRLKKNKVLAAEGFTWTGDSETDIPRAYEMLRLRSLEIIKTNANAVFLTTAVSQNGTLDALSVTVTLLKMIRSVTIVYENRPSWRRLVYLYTQIAGVIFIARSIEDMDLIEEQLEPLITSLVGSSVLSVIPGSAAMTNLVMSSLMEGSVNALLTLRVGIVAQTYLSASTEVNKGKVRRAAFLQATGLLAEVMKTNAVHLIKVFGRAAKKATKATTARLNPFSKEF